MFNRILIAYDESKEARKALDTGMKLAAELHSKVTIATILEPLPGYYGLAAVVDPSLADEVRQGSRERLLQLQTVAKEEATRFGLEVETLLLEGQETEAILEATRIAQADLLVVGLRRHMPGFEWAGTVRQVANKCACPILAVS